MSLLREWIAADGTHLALDGSQGVKVNRGAIGLDGPPIRNTLDQRIGNGAVRVNFRHPERPFTLPLQVDVDAIATDTVADLLQGPGTLVSTSGRKLRSVVYDAGLEGAWSIDSGGIGSLSHRKFPASFVALDPWWYGETQYLNGVFAAPTPWDAAIPWDSPIPWNGGSSQPVTNAGREATPVTIVLIGAATTVSMSIDGVGGWETAQSIPSGEYLSVSGLVDERGPHRGPHGLFPAADDPVDWALLTPTSQLFDLPAGQSSLVMGATGTDASTAWYLFWSPRYLTS